MFCFFSVIFPENCKRETSFLLERKRYLLFYTTTKDYSHRGSSSFLKIYVFQRTDVWKVVIGGIFSLRVEARVGGLIKSLFSFISSCGHIFPWKGMITEGWKLKTVSRSNIRSIITYKNWIWYRHSKTGYNYTIETDWGRVIFTTDGCASPVNLRDIH